MQIVGGGGGYKKRGNGEKVPTVSSYSRRSNSIGPRGSQLRANNPPNSMSRANSNATQPSRQGSKGLSRSASGIAAMMRLDEQISAGEL